MMSAINYGEEEGRTMKSDGVEMLMGVRYGTVPDVVDGWHLITTVSATEVQCRPRAK
jgi:hypothetical protein